MCVVSPHPTTSWYSFRLVLVHYVFILHIQNVFNSHRQRISGQRSEPNNTVSEFHLSAVEGMLS